MKDPTKWSTPNPRCQACEARRFHDPVELRYYHPYAGHGYERGRWTDPMLDPLPPLELHGECDPEENR
jgi:hypothetical protein